MRAEMTHISQEPVIGEVAPAMTGEITGYLAERPGRRSEGIGGAPLDRRHALLGLREVLAHPKYDNSRDHDFTSRHGHNCRPVVLRLPDGPAGWSMWRRAFMP
jgi:hypothetical protein